MILLFFYPSLAARVLRTGKKIIKARAHLPRDAGTKMYKVEVNGSIVFKQVP